MAERPGPTKRLFLTVGTTSFDRLVDAVDQITFLDKLAALGFSRFIMQIGKGEREPRVASHAGVSVEWFRFKPTLDDEIRAADLIISHAGAGSILEALRAQKRLLVVINDALMDNHQTEVAEAMHDDNYLTTATSPAPDVLLTKVEEALVRPLDPYPPCDRSKFYEAIQRHTGVPPVGSDDTQD
ncbi:unnamed protein product [Vitrella brassicaformis CCMP3155]|uniref:UDP-N-acetylglucosamine transferase subunit ALG13 n=2 Tax=Vitrella brassicaformis TaxID=1169539 RepID=A0A0G4G700_VITBC|nr:unnamed protein product [Vitrella brassicaformis CCMP3155]|eukprot:CEM24395.1 unnamed protein product [Vitrella brassicaformis CCMP3155]